MKQKEKWLELRRSLEKDLQEYRKDYAASGRDDDRVGGKIAVLEDTLELMDELEDTK